MSCVDLLKKSAKAGNPDACFRLAVMYCDGSNEFRKHRPSAEKWFIESGRLGYEPAMIRLAEFYTKNRKLAANISSENAELLNVFGCTLLAKKDPELYVTAYKLFRFASLQDIDAQLNLAYCKFEGIGTKKNYGEAYTLLYDVFPHEEGEDDTFGALTSKIHNGVDYTPPKSSTSTKVTKKKRKQKNIAEAESLLHFICKLIEILLFPLFFPLVLFANYDPEDSPNDYDGPTIGLFGCFPIVGILYLIIASSIIIFLISLFSDSVTFSTKWYFYISCALIVLGFIFSCARSYNKNGRI